MPELPEVETVKRGLEPVLLGQCISKVELRRANLRFPFPLDFASRVEGMAITHLSRRAKYILVSFQHGETLIIHLGMTGRFTVLSPQDPRNDLGEFYFQVSPSENAEGAHDHVLFTLQNGVRLVYSDPRRFGMMDVSKTTALDQHKLLRDIGVEPLGNALSAAYLAQKFKSKKAPLKAALLDQRIIAGLGNIYVCEALHRANLSPLRHAGTLVKAKSHDPRLDDLVRHIKDILIAAIEAGGSTLQDFVGADGEKGAYQQRFSAYDREGEPCDNNGCKGHIKRITQSGRSTFYCPTCQK
ncbi:MAG: bifunctional DNA-formamidopyrimidine glycosylase/DNA-(apurinic or apyrimidinic site) lyase [Alphaproteobacteria bacterium]|nr:bifunctional DNA-formamidopyrimidine glycosylase/DNA-(apurinic or apyrimidinic site) lyase [Alphaproteobacteria bacterium]